MHTDISLGILDEGTTQLGGHLRRFVTSISVDYETRELRREADARRRRETRKANQREAHKASSSAASGPAPTICKSSHPNHDKPQQSDDTQAPSRSRKLKTFRLNTYKHHALGDVVATIRQFGTTESYSTEPVRPCFNLS
jgi:hypothetical protein